MTNIQFCEKLFEKLVRAKDKADEFIILDYFSLKTLELIEKVDIGEIEKYAVLFQEFGERCNKEKPEWEIYFFALNNLLENKWYYIQNDNKEELKENIKNYVKALKEVVENV